jgi:hypothetical protein
MDSPTQPIADPASHRADPSTGFACDSMPATAEDVVRAFGSPHLIAAGRGAPPASLIEEMALADRIHAELQAGGREVRFVHDIDGGLSIQLRDRDGRLLATLSVAEAVELAGGL